MIEAFEKAEAQGDAAVLYEGQHIDYAHVKTARAGAGCIAHWPATGGR